MKAKREGKKVCAYGAAAKGNTFINFAGVKSDLIQFECIHSSVVTGMFFC